MIVASVEIPVKLPSLNDYVRACRSGPYAGAQMKQRIQRDIGWYIRTLPMIEGPCRIHFTWTEKTRRRDLDNVSFAKKFILDEMVALAVLEDDSRKFVTGFTDTFRLGNEWSVKIDIEQEQNND